ncbi:hypothetical protein BCR32DRAFT_290996 [Anaeromyces robustus]|uniref:Uncharacterized protein n=1 Tax=Anaeromyces robustus TaxID=1754192 RepID=A0A1Y1XGR3_9FUNG|nr:hypothetical protein BCR32DRAFT_290996 [Anaeromyces robustus]|eukprot:ORX84937.1 hypothetical protein BCR32DRAFT_290996 [Anaeromyces robustus]
MEANESIVIKNNNYKKPSATENQYRNVKRIFPRIKTCCCCFCISFDLAIKLSTMLLIVWFFIVVGYNIRNETFNVGVVIYIAVIISAFVFLYGILKQYLFVFFIFLIYYVYFCFKNVIQALSLKASEDEIKTKLEFFYKDLTIDQMHELLDDTKFFIIMFTIVPLIIYVYYFLACGSYVELIEENISDELLARELEEDIQ